MPPRGPLTHWTPGIPTFTLAAFTVILFTDSVVTPGAPINFRWESWPGGNPGRPGGPRVDLGAVTVSLHLVNAFGNADPQAVLYMDTLSAHDSQAVVSGHFTSPPVAASAFPDDLARRVYRVGTLRLRLVLTGTGTDGPFESTDAVLFIVPPPVDDTWWSWSVPVFRTVMWKNDKYVVAGTLANKSAQPVTFAVTLLETMALPGAPGGAGELAMGSVASSAPLGTGGTIPVTFATVNLSKAWSWFVSGVFITSAPVFRFYTYRVRLDITDPYGNAFAPFFTTQNITVKVEVSAQKQAALGIASMLMVNAAALLIAALVAASVGGEIGGLVAAGLVSAAASLAAAAAIAGVIAGDPPVPDQRFRETYEPIPVTFLDVEQVQPFTRFGRAVADVIATVEALAETDSRLAGAFAANDPKHIALQREHFQSLISQLPPLERAVADATPAAAEFMASEQIQEAFAKADDAIRALRHDMQFRARTAKDWQEAGGSIGALETIEGLIAEPEFSTLLAHPDRLIAATGAAAESLARAGADSTPTEPGS